MARKKRKTVEARQIAWLANNDAHIGHRMFENDAEMEAWIRSRGASTLADAFRLGARNLAATALLGTNEIVPVTLLKVGP